MMNRSRADVLRRKFMYVVIINFPPIMKGKDAEFIEWFAWSNRELARHKGYLGRRLLRPAGGGNYVAVMELESRGTFAAMQHSPEHDEVAGRVAGLLNGWPDLRQYEVVVG
jgi:heme-degrading monooxygenase HmoA